nr:alkylmercury lyase [Mycolicibacterium rhodesiae]
MRVEFLSSEACRNAPAVRRLLDDCLAEADIEVQVVERLGAFRSPSVLVDGIDVVQPGDAISGDACRLDLPTREQILAALTNAMRGLGDA